MNITKSASILDWRTNTQGRWTAVADDIAPSTQDISFGNGYTATVTNRKITVENQTRPSGTVTYAVEDVANTAYAGNLAAVGSVKDTLDVVTGERTSKTVTITLDGTENWVNYTYTSGTKMSRGFTIYNFLNYQPNRLAYIVDNSLFGSVSGMTEWDGNKPVIWIGVSNANLYIAWNAYNNQAIVPSSWYDYSTDTLNVAGFKAWLAEHPVTVTYAPPANQQPEPVEDIPQPLSLSTGSNIASMTDTSTGNKPSFPMSYDGTDYTISTKSARVYLKDVNGTVERVTGVTSIPVRGGRDNVMDLTRMFGSGLEPGTLDAFYSLFPAWRGYKLPYNEGNLLNFKGTGLKSVGFNQFNGEYSEEGKYLTSTGTLTANASYNVTDYLRAIPGQTYRLTAYGNAPSICWYTYDKTLISGTAYGHASTWQEDVFTAPANAYWVRFSVYMPRVAETCFYFQWTGTRNGDYEPYWDYTRPIPTLTYFQDGMNGRGNIYDEINDRQAIRRFGVVDLGTLEWIWQSGGDYGYWRSSSIQNSIKIPSTTSTVASVISDYYSATSQSTIGGSAEKAGLLAITSTGSIYINTGSTTESPSGWLVYELATPVVTTFSEEISTTARISDFGTEECLPVNGHDPVTAPFRGMVLYQDDYARTITKLPENYQSQESMDNLLVLLGQLHNGIISATFDAASQSYKYNFTPNE